MLGRLARPRLASVPVVVHTPHGTDAYTTSTSAPVNSELSPGPSVGPAGTPSHHHHVGLRARPLPGLANRARRGSCTPSTAGWITSLRTASGIARGDLLPSSGIEPGISG